MKQEYELLVEESSDLATVLRLVGDQAAQLAQDGFEGYGIKYAQSGSVYVAWLEMSKYHYADDNDDDDAAEPIIAECHENAG